MHRDDDDDDDDAELGGDEAAAAFLPFGGGASEKSSDVSTDQIRQAAAFAKSLATNSGELFRHALNVPLDSSGRAFYEYEPTDSDPFPGYVAVEKFVSDKLTDIANRTDKSGNRTKAAKKLMERVAQSICGTGSAVTPVSLQCKYLRDYEKLLKMVAPKYTLLKGDIIKFFPSEAAVDAALSTSLVTVDLSGTSQ